MDLTATGINNFRNSTINSSMESSIRGVKSKEEQKLIDATIDFETLFIKQMLNSMRKTVSKSGLLDGGQGQEIFEDMLYDEYSKKIAQTARLGISEMMYRQLSTIKPEI